MNIRFNQDGSVDNIAVNQFVNQLSSGQKIGVFVTGLAANEFTARAYGVLPNGDSTIISCVPVDGSNYWEITLNTANTAYAGKLTITVQIILNQTNYVFTYPLYLTVNPTIPGNVEFPITLDEVTTFLTQLQNYPTKAAADARFQRKYDINTLRVYNSLARAEEDSNILANQYILVRTAPGEFSIYVKNTNSTFTKISIDEAAKALKDGDGNIITTYYLPRINFTTFQNDLEEGHIVVGNAEKASKKTGTDDELATERYVDNKIGTLSAHYVTYDIYGNSFPTKAALLAGPYYYGIDIHEPDDNDYAFVDADETHDGKPARYVYQYNTWNFQYVIPTPVAGVTDVKVDGESVLNPQKVANINLTGKQDKIVVESDSDITIGGLAVPKLTVEQVETIYNHLISGNSVVVSSDDGIKHFSPIVADYLDGAAIHFLYCNLLITYYIENDTVKNEYIDLDNVVHKSGDETISGVKTFSNKIKVQTGEIEATSTALAIRNNGANVIAFFSDRVETYQPVKTSKVDLGNQVDIRSNDYNGFVIYTLGYAQFTFYAGYCLFPSIYPSINDTYSLGQEGQYWKECLVNNIKSEGTAQYKKTRLLSESEYEALSEEEKNNGVIYNIYED